MSKKKQPKTRPDIKDDAEWLTWLAEQDENAGIDVRALFRRMLSWCKQKGMVPSRRRLLVWLENERDSVPMTIAAAVVDPNCPECHGQGKAIAGNFRAPCIKCFPEENAAFWKARGK